MTETNDKLDFKRILPILVIVLVDVMGLTIIIPILPFYALAFDASPLLIGLLAATYPLMQFIFGPILGSLSDRVGRKPVLAGAQVGTFVSLLVLGFAGNLYMLFFARLIDGITGANIATVQSAISDSTSPKNRATGLGLIGATFGIGFVLGPVLSGIALRLSGNNYSAPAFLAAGFALVSILLTTFMFEETLPVEKRGTPTKQYNQGFGRLLTALRDPNLGILFALMLMLQIIFGSFQATFAPFTLNRLGLNSLGNTIFFATFGIILAFVQGGLVGPLTKRFGERAIVVTGLGLFAFGFLLAGFTPQQAVPWYSREAMTMELAQQSVTPVENNQLNLLPPEEGSGVGALFFLLLGILPMPIGFGLLQPNISSLITQRADPRQVGEALGLGAAFMAGGTAIGPLLGGGIFDWLGPNYVYLINGIAATVLWIFIARRLRT